MTAKQLTAPTTIRIEPEIKTWLLQESHRQKRSLSNLINIIIQKEMNSAVTFQIGGQTLKGILRRGDNNDTQ